MAIQQRWLYCSRCHYWASGRAKLLFRLCETHLQNSGHAWHWRLWAGPTDPLIPIGYTNMGELSALARSRRRNHLFMIPVKGCSRRILNSLRLTQFWYSATAAQAAQLWVHEHRFKWQSSILWWNVCQVRLQFVDEQWTSFLMEESNRNALPGIKVVFLGLTPSSTCILTTVTQLSSYRITILQGSELQPSSENSSTTTGNASHYANLACHVDRYGWQEQRIEHMNVHKFVTRLFKTDLNEPVFKRALK